MRTGLTVAAAATLLILLTWVALRGMSAEVGAWKDALLAIDKLRGGKRAQPRRAQRAVGHAAQLRSPGAGKSNEMRGAVTRLRANGWLDPEIAAAIGEVMQVRGPDARGLTEQFKSRNALLQNSLAYFIVFGERSIEEEQEPEPGRAGQRSGAAILASDTRHLPLGDRRGCRCAAQDDHSGPLAGGPPAGGSPGWDPPPPNR